ncbi:hypothetical protein EX30DRAFT_347640 [Ascodesmis nigricans]|uniref:Protein transport protein sec16 n=1 Tax=Ascodesmis nigricans TaxID=341454 RepID=A0A4S2N2J6_9PEZI|nr:hypothetical protein EX30DRAFT_347640 [Ascodesmis nigricans]
MEDENGHRNPEGKPDLSWMEEKHESLDAAKESESRRPEVNPEPHGTDQQAPDHSWMEESKPEASPSPPIGSEGEQNRKDPDLSWMGDSKPEALPSPPSGNEGEQNQKEPDLSWMGESKPEASPPNGGEEENGPKQPDLSWIGEQEAHKPDEAQEDPDLSWMGEQKVEAPPVTNESSDLLIEGQPGESSTEQREEPVPESEPAQIPAAVEPDLSWMGGHEEPNTSNVDQGPDLSWMGQEEGKTDLPAELGNGDEKAEQEPEPRPKNEQNGHQQEEEKPNVNPVEEEAVTQFHENNQEPLQSAQAPDLSWMEGGAGSDQAESPNSPDQVEEKSDLSWMGERAESTPAENNNGHEQRKEKPDLSWMGGETSAPPAEDQMAKWQAALGDDDELLDEDGFLPSDDEGFLPSDDEDQAPVQQPPTNYPAVPIAPSIPSIPIPPAISSIPGAPFVPPVPAVPVIPALRGSRSAYFAPPAPPPATVPNAPPKPPQKQQFFEELPLPPPKPRPQTIVPPRPIQTPPNPAIKGPPNRSNTGFFEELPMAPPKPRAQTSMGSFQQYAPRSSSVPPQYAQSPPSSVPHQYAQSPPASVRPQYAQSPPASVRSQYAPRSPQASVRSQYVPQSPPTSVSLQYGQSPPTKPPQPVQPPLNVPPQSARPPSAVTSQYARPPPAIPPQSSQAPLAVPSQPARPPSAAPPQIMRPPSIVPPQPPRAPSAAANRGATMEVDNRPIGEFSPVSEEAMKFPGPMWTGSKGANKTKKKEALTYIDSRVEAMENSTMDVYNPADRRGLEEKILLWKVVRVMVEHDGVAEGTPEIQAQVRKILVPDALQNLEGDGASGFVSMTGMISSKPAVGDPVDPIAVATFRQKLLTGDREAAVWFAADKRLWAHAFLIAGTVGPDLWKKVVQEFVKSEVKSLGPGSESLAVLYDTLSGNWEESVDELVPPSARLGVPMLTAQTEREQSLEERLGKWKETLALILSNRSPGDQASLLALGRLLAGYGWTSAAHVCFVFARQTLPGGAGALFGGSDESTTDFALLGADHRSPSFGRDLDTIILSEIYEFAVSLSPTASTATPIFPHLQIWKIRHAYFLADHGKTAPAQKYCDAIAGGVKAWNRPSPYFNQEFGKSLEELTKRVQEASKDASAGGSGWIPKLTSDAVSNSVWGAFNKFIEGTDESNNNAQTEVAGDGHFGGPPARSVEQHQQMAMSQGVDMYSAGYPGGSSQYNPMVGSAPTNSAANKYAPSPNISQPTSTRTSLEAPRNPYEPRRIGSEGYQPTVNGYDPSNPYDPQAQQQQQSQFNQTPSNSTATNNLTPRSSLEAPTPQIVEPAQQESQAGGYQPPSYGGYEPPTQEFTPYQPEPDSDQEDKKKETLKKKKSFLDLDAENDGYRFTKTASAPPAAVAAKATPPPPPPSQPEEKKEGSKGNEDKKEEKKAQPQKKGWLSGWFSRSSNTEGQTSGPIKANLGEESTFYYDPDLKRWINKKAPPESQGPAKAPPPPKRHSSPAAPPSSSATPSAPSTPPPARAATPPVRTGSAPPIRVGSVPPVSTSVPPPTSSPMVPSTSGLLPPPPVSASGPPSRGPSPAPPMGRSVSTNSAVPPTAKAPPRPPVKDAMDELLGPPMPRKGTPAGRKAKKGASRYVETPGLQ